MFSVRRSATFALLTIITMLSAPSWAGVITYNFDINVPNGNAVTDVFIYSTGGGQDSVFASPDDIAASGIQSLSHTVDFTPERSLIVGLNHGVNPEDPTDIIMFTNVDFAWNAVGFKWSNFFAPMRHSTFITLLGAAHAGDATALGEITNFFRTSQVAAATFDTFGAASILQFTVAEPPIGGTVPEPATLLLFALALAGLAMMQKVRAR